LTVEVVRGPGALSGWVLRTRNYLWAIFGADVIFVAAASSTGDVIKFPETIPYASVVSLFG